MKYRRVFLSAYALSLCLFLGGCGGGTGSSNAPESAEAIKQQEAATAENVKLQKNPLDVKK